MSGKMADNEILGQAFEVLNTITHFIECGDVADLIDNEIKNYFMMCQQVEIFQEKFLQKGFVLAVDKERGAHLTSKAVDAPGSDLELLADRLLEKFCRSSDVKCRLSTAVKEYLDRYGSSRFTRFLEAVASTKGNFNLSTVLEKVDSSEYNLEGPVYLHILEHVATGARGMPRVRDMINEWLCEDLCADTIVTIMASDHKESEKQDEIKHEILLKLEEKYSKLPHARMWLVMVCSLNLVSAVTNYPPMTAFVLKLIKSLSSSITYDPTNNTYSSEKGHLTYNNLVHVMAKLYRNPTTTQDIVNFVFNQFKVDPTVWGSILTACHNYPIQETTREIFYESLYNKQLTDPNISSESLQLMLNAIAQKEHQQMAAALSIAYINSIAEVPASTSEQDDGTHEASVATVEKPRANEPLSNEASVATVVRSTRKRRHPSHLRDFYYYD